MARFYVINSIKEEWEKTKELPLVKPQIPPVRAQLPPPKDKNHKIWLIASVLFALLIIGGLFAYPLISDGPIAGQAIGDRREIQKIEPIPILKEKLILDPVVIECTTKPYSYAYNLQTVTDKKLYDKEYSLYNNYKGDITGCTEENSLGKPWCATNNIKKIKVYPSGGKQKVSFEKGDFQECSEVPNCYVVKGGGVECLPSGHIIAGCTDQEYYFEKDGTLAGPFTECNKLDNGLAPGKWWCPTMDSARLKEVDVYITGGVKGTNWLDCPAPPKPKVNDECFKEGAYGQSEGYVQTMWCTLIDGKLEWQFPENSKCDLDKECQNDLVCTNNVCSKKPIEICTDGIDNNNDGKIDCQDPECAGKMGGNGFACCNANDPNAICKSNGALCDTDSYYGTFECLECMDNEWSCSDTGNDNSICVNGGCIELKCALDEKIENGKCVKSTVCKEGETLKDGVCVGISFIDKEIYLKHLDGNGIGTNRYACYESWEGGICEGKVDKGTFKLVATTSGFILQEPTDQKTLCYFVDKGNYLVRHCGATLPSDRKNLLEVEEVNGKIYFKLKEAELKDGEPAYLCADNSGTGVQTLYKCPKKTGYVTGSISRSTEWKVELKCSSDEKIENGKCVTIGSCSDDTQCNFGICVNQKCTKGEVDEPCKDDTQCKGELICKDDNKCSPKEKDPSCIKIDDCDDDGVPNDKDLICTKTPAGKAVFEVTHPYFPGCMKADINLDNKINVVDLDYFLDHYEKYIEKYPDKGTPIDGAKPIQTVTIEDLDFFLDNYEKNID